MPDTKPKKIIFTGQSKITLALVNVVNWLLDNGGSGGSGITPNPSGTATDNLVKAEIDGTIYAIQDSDAVHTADVGTAAAKDVPASGDASSTEVVMGNDSRLTDARNAADVYAWAKAATKPSYTASEVGAIPSTDKGANNGVASLDSSGKVPSSQLPSYVDDVVEGYYDSTTDRFYEESTFETVIPPVDGKSWVDVSTNKSYRWTGSVYVRVDEGVQLGETSSTAYRGDRGKTAYDHATDANKVSSAVASGLYKVGVTDEGHIASTTAVTKSDITSLGITADDVGAYSPTDTTEATLADDDKVPFYDTSASGKRNSTWSNIKSKLQSFFETIFVTIASLDGTVFVEKTYAEYQALSEAQKNDGKVNYYITDLDDIDYAVQDDTTATDLINDEVPTGGTIESWAKTQYVTAGQRSGFTLGAKATAEGNYTEASGDYSHAEGSWTKASGYASHAEGAYTSASGHFSHAEGSGASSSFKSVASGDYSHVEGHFTTAQGDYSHAEGYCTNAYEDFQHVQGKYNESKSDTLFEIGNGTADNARKNVFEVTANGVRPVVISSDTVTITTGHNAVFKLWSNGMKSFNIEDNSFPSGNSIITGAVIPDKYVPLVGNPRGVGWTNNYASTSASVERCRPFTIGQDKKIYVYAGVAVGLYATLFYI